eukprot:COSAG02_NODE_3563_length_6554_cov_7.849419_4_plen_242_part_00
MQQQQQQQQQQQRRQHVGSSSRQSSWKACSRTRSCRNNRPRLRASYRMASCPPTPAHATTLHTVRLQHTVSSSPSQRTRCGPRGTPALTTSRVQNGFGAKRVRGSSAMSRARPAGLCCLVACAARATRRAAISGSATARGTLPVAPDTTVFIHLIHTVLQYGRVYTLQYRTIRIPSTAELCVAGTFQHVDRCPRVGIQPPYGTVRIALHVFRAMTFHWKIVPQSVSREFLETDWGADRKLD